MLRFSVTSCPVSDDVLISFQTEIMCYNIKGPICRIEHISAPMCQCEIHLLFPSLIISMILQFFNFGFSNLLASAIASCPSVPKSLGGFFLLSDSSSDALCTGYYRDNIQ